MIALRAEALLLNAALGVGIGLLVSWGTKKITEAAQRVQNVATQSKEAADAAQSTTSSLKDLVSAYEELGDKSGWDTEDFDQAKDIQAEILDLAKEQGTLDENKLSKLNLQNGKYEEQLGLLQDITAEQLEASRYELTQNKDAQGNKLVDTAKKNNRTHYLTVWSAPEMDMGDQIKNAGIDVFNKFGGYGPDKLNDADSIVDYYNEVGKALKYVIDNTTEAERAAGGTYHSLYQFLLDEQSALRDDVDSYNDSTDAINNNTNARRKLQAVDFWQNDNNNSMDVSFTFDKVNSAVQTLENTIDGFDASKLNELLWGKNEGLSDEQAQALANLRKALTDMDFSADTNGVNDHGAETVYFEIDRYFDQHDLSDEICVIQFRSVGPNGDVNEGFFPITKLDIETVPGKILFGWTVLSDATKYAGDVQFSVRFYSIETENDEPKFAYDFNTVPATLPIKNSLNTTGEGAPVDPTAVETMISRFADIERRANDSIANTAASRDAAAVSAKNAATSESNAQAHMNDAQTAMNTAREHRDAAADSKTAAKTSETAAKASETASAKSAADALASLREAQEAAEKADQTIATKGWIWLDDNNDSGILTLYVADSVADNVTMRDDGHGNLEVVLS